MDSVLVVGPHVSSERSLPLKEGIGGANILRASSKKGNHGGFCTPIRHPSKDPPPEVRFLNPSKHLGPPQEVYSPGYLGRGNDKGSLLFFFKSWCLQSMNPLKVHRFLIIELGVISRYF